MVTRFSFDSAASFAAWLSAAFPEHRCAVRGDGVEVRDGLFSAVILRAKLPNRLEVEEVIPSSVVLAIVQLLQVQCAVVPIVVIRWLYAGIETPRVFVNAAGAISNRGVAWYLTVIVGVCVCGMAPRWLANAVSRSGCGVIRRRLATLFATGVVGAR